MSVTKTHNDLIRLFHQLNSLIYSLVP